STRLNSSHVEISYAVFCLTKVQTCARSEEHTSELQSRRDLVCRLLLEIKEDNVTVAAAGIRVPPLLVSGGLLPYMTQCFFFFKDPPTPGIYPLPLPAAFPI